MSSLPKWIESTGGPLIAIPETHLLMWTGTDGPDYERACAISNYVGTLSVGDAQALVFGDEPMSTTCVELPSVGLLIARWMWAPDRASATQALASVTKNDFVNPLESIAVRSASRRYRMFDSAFPYSEVDSQLALILPSGQYCVRTIEFAPSDTTRFIISGVFTQF